MHSPVRRLWAGLSAVLLILVIVPGALLAQVPPPVVTPPPQTRTAAQTAAAAAGYDVSNARIAEAIRQSGLTEAQLREQLQDSGYDPGLADPFFAAQAAGTEGAEASAEFVSALQALGLVDEGGEETEEEAERASPDRVGGGAGGVFGKSIFRRASTAFDPVTSGPVDSGFRLGVGDQLQLILTGDVELAHSLEIRRDGTVVIPQVGQISLAGLTLEGARTLLKQRAARSYSGLASGRTVLDLTTSRIRTNAVFVIGEVEDPGAYQVNALGTVFHALARAGGPTVRGSFRAVELRRGGEVVNTLDLYRYLLDGDASDDVRLEQGDVIFVPLNYRAVAVSGAVRRSGVFELAPSEGFADLIRFAGGLSPQASHDRVQVDRILPPEERAPGFDRVKIDVILDGQIERGDVFPLLEGDILTVFAIGDLRRNTVTISGAVFQPGEFEFVPGMSVDSLILLAQGFLPFAMQDRVMLRRLIPETGRSESVFLNLQDPSTGEFLLEEFDEVRILDGRRDFPGRTVSVSGAVNASGERGFLEFETLRDLIDRAGGFREGAQLVELSRRMTGPAYSDTTSVVSDFFAAVDFVEGGAADKVIMEPFDRVDVRLSPGYRSQRFVSVAGEFRNPGAYAISEGVDRVSDIVERAGGTLPHAYPGSFQLTREGLPVALDFSRVLRADPEHDITVRAGDRLSIVQDPRVVRVEGAVIRPSLIRFERGRSLEDYVELAGGPSERGQMHRAVVAYPNGFSRRVKRHLWLVKSTPEVTSGSVITVPVKPESQTSVGDVFTRIFQTSATITSLVIAWSAINR